MGAQTRRAFYGVESFLSHTPCISFPVLRLAFFGISNGGEHDLIISDGTPAGSYPKDPFSALTIDLGFPVLRCRRTLFDDLIPLDQETWEVGNALPGHATAGMNCGPG